MVVADYEGKLINKFEIEGQPNLHHFSYRDEFTGTVVTSNGRYLATTFGELAKATVAVYDLQTGREVFKLENQNGGPRVYFSRGRQTLYVKYGNKPIRRFEAATGKELDELPDTDPWVTQVVESPDGKLLVFGRHFSITSQKQRDLVKLLEVRDAATGKFTGKIELPGGPENLTFVGNETLMVHTRIPQSVPGKATFSRWNVPKQQCEWEVPAIGQWGFVLSPDNKRFASIGQQRVFTFNAETGEREVDPYYHSGPVEWIRFSADGKTLTTAAPGEVITWTNSGRRKETVGVPELRHGMQSVFNNARAHHGNELVWLDVGWNSGSSRNPEAQTIFGWDREKNAFGWKFKAASVLQVCRPEGNRVVCLGSNPKVKSDYVVTHYDGLTGKVVRE